MAGVPASLPDPKPLGPSCSSPCSTPECPAPSASCHRQTVVALPADSSEGRTKDQPYTTFVGDRSWPGSRRSGCAATPAPSGLSIPRRSTAVGYIKKVIPRAGCFVNGRLVDVREQTPLGREARDRGLTSTPCRLAGVGRPDGWLVVRWIADAEEVDCKQVSRGIRGRRMRIHLAVGR
ncbi:hypothetical protein FAIPA1_60169 [Frankia sp. AiPs1]